MAAALIVVTFTAPRDLVLHNRSPSAPEGFYVRADAPATEETFVTIRARDVAPAEAGRRRFTGPNDRFIKRVAAVGGERVCGDGHGVVVGNDAIVLTALSASEQHNDRDGAVVGWRGCRILNANEVLLLGDTPDSFDGRYWARSTCVLSKACGASSDIFHTRGYTVIRAATSFCFARLTHTHC